MRKSDTMGCLALIIIKKKRTNINCVPKSENGVGLTLFNNSKIMLAKFT